LPTDRPRPPVYSHRGASLPVALPRALVADLEGLAKDHRTTLFAVLLSAWQILLHRFTGQAQLLLGTPVSGRRQPELEALVGCFLNTLVISADFRSDPAFGEFLERTRTELLEALAHQDLPFERLVEGLQPRRDPSRPPLVQALVGLHHVPLSPGRVATVELTPMEQAESSAKADLSLILERTAETVDGVLEFATDLFDRTTIQRLHGQLLRLLERIGGFREQGSSLPVGRWPVVSAAACHQLLVEWGTGPFPQRALQGGQPEPFHRRVAVWAQRQPQARAVVAKDGSWSYGELDSWSLSLAHRLVRRGLELEEPVGLFLGRSPEMVGSLLAVLRAGGAFVPLDPAYPPDRLAFMIEDAGVSTVLTLRSLAPELPAAVDSLVLVDAPGEGLGTSREEWERALPAVAPSALAYIIYTSGSTGRPKGVAVHHGGLSHLWAAQEQVFGVGPGDRVLQFAALSFDASIFEIAMALAAGAALFLTPPEAAVSGPPLRKFLAMQGISVATLTPSALATLPAEDLPAEDLPAGDLASLDTLVVAGEACPPELAERWTESAAGRRFFNAYGPTEVTVWASTELYCRQRALGIGRPIPGAHVAVLDRRGELSPASVPGQLHIGGPGVARGYRGRPSLTADRFRPDPAALGGRLYSTGDLARWRPDGRLDFLGRLDHQVKVRGFRIELGEVEAAVAGLAGIREAVAAVLSPATGEPRLAVYFVPDSSSPPEVEALRQAVRRRLPEHMVPSAWVLLERLPLAVTGKVDRRALPSPERQDLGLAAVVPPRDRLELELLDLFRQILGPVVAGVFDDFFEAGGHSLAAIRLVAGVEAKLGFPLPLTALFEAGTVAALAQRLRSAESTPGSREILVPICSPGSSSSPVSAPVPPLVLVHPVGGNVFSYAALAQSLRRERPVMAIQSPPPESWPVPPSVEAMAARYLQELGSWSGRPAAGMPVLAGWSLGAVVAFEMARQAAQAGAEVSAVLLIDPPTPPFGEVGEQAGGDEDEARIAAAFLLDLTGFGGAGSDDAVATEGIIRELAALGPRERAQEILHRAVAARALPATESVDRVEALLSLFRLNARALAAYRPLPAAERAMASSAPPVHLYRAKGSSEDPDEGAWRRLCAPSHLMIHPLTGDHYSLLRAPGVAELGRAMEETLAALPAIPARLAGSS
ncbi:MAG: amino acid adenylation domain-containing protein, partial [Acidobacteriota bacterium]|nr:amino acid adenylation domain-containing protein [Acidobacteriota bacterium]